MYFYMHKVHSWDKQLGYKEFSLSRKQYFLGKFHYKRINQTVTLSPIPTSDVGCFIKKKKKFFSLYLYIKFFKSQHLVLKKGQTKNKNIHCAVLACS